MAPGHGPSAPSQRRLALRAATKVLAAVALLAIGYVLFSSSTSSMQAGDDRRVTIDLAGLAPGEVKRIEWEGRQLVVLHRNATMLEALGQSNPSLADPDSADSRQPAGAVNRFRSLDPLFLVVLGHGTDLGCPVQWAGPEAEGAPAPWHGGFRDRCRGSWYDLAGRVYAGQPATRNLPVPPHHFSEATVLHLQ